MSKDSPPSAEALAASWTNVRFSEDTAISSAMQATVTAFKKSFGKKVFFKSFNLAAPDPAFDWYLTRNRFHEMGFFEKFWRAPGVTEAFPFKLAELDYSDMYVFEWGSAYTLAGMWAWALDIGGANSAYHEKPLTIKALTDAAAAALIQDKYDETFVIECNLAWNDFFWGDALDKTWIIINLATRKLHVLMISDVD